MKAKPDAFQQQAGMVAYTKWWIAHPWHVTKGMDVPPDCDCGYSSCPAQEKRGNE